MTVRCPHCFSALPPTHFAYVCAGSCKSQRDDVLTRWHGAPMSSATITEIDTAAMQPERRGLFGGQQGPAAAPPMRCAACNGATTECCPICHFPFPPKWREYSTTCIALAGSRSTGKSVYIGVLIQFLDLFLDRQQGYLKLEADSWNRYEEVYKKALDEARNIPGTTRAAQADAPQRMPLILRGRVNGQPHALVLRDVAGEDLEKDDAPPGSLDFYANATAVFFMFDPTAVRDIRNRLDLLNRFSEAGAEPEKVLPYVIRLMRGRGNLAVIMSKFDIIHQLRNVDHSVLRAALLNPGAGIRRDPGPTEQYNAADTMLVSEEIRSLLLKLNPSGIVAAIERDPNNAGIRASTRYFAVSALGAQPTPDKLDPSGITPYRILDPIRWALQLP